VLDGSETTKVFELTATPSEEAVRAPDAAPGRTPTSAGR